MEAFPYAWIFFVVFILVSTFTLLNLFIGVIVNAIETEVQQDTQAARDAVAARVDEDAAALAREIAALRSELRELKAALVAREPR